MKRLTFLTVIQLIILPLLTVSFSIVANTAILDKFLSSIFTGTNLADIKGWASAVTSIITTLVLTLTVFYFRNKCDDTRKHLSRMGEVFRDQLWSSLEEFSATPLAKEGRIDIRFYKISKKKITLIDKRGFCDREISGILTFDRTKNEGAVSAALAQKLPIAESGDGCFDDKYHLTPYQKSIISGANIHFFIVVPVFRDGKDIPIGIVSFDSRHEFRAKDQDRYCGFMSTVAHQISTIPD